MSCAHYQPDQEISNFIFHSLQWKSEYNLQVCICLAFLSAVRYYVCLFFFCLFVCLLLMPHILNVRQACMIVSQVCMCELNKYTGDWLTYASSFIGPNAKQKYGYPFQREVNTYGKSSPYVASELAFMTSGLLFSTPTPFKNASRKHAYIILTPLNPTVI